jgi:hypothetical protein
MAIVERFPRVEMEAEVTGALPAEGAPSVHSEPIPDGVEHVEEGSQGASKAVARDFESALKEIEAMGAELTSLVKKCEAMTSDVQNVTALIASTAEAYRREGKKIFERIEECAASTDDVRRRCEDIKRRMIKGNGA